MKGRLAAIAVVALAAAIFGGVAWSSGALGYRRDARTFDLTGVGAAGVWTLEPVNGINGWWKDFPPATLFVRTGDEIVIHLRSADVFHRFYLPEFSVGPVEVDPGHTATVRFVASRKGVFQYYCTSMCGRCHFHMRGWVVVSDPGETPVQPPAAEPDICPLHATAIPAKSSLIERGARLYEAKGCATCHGPKGRGGIPNANSTSGTVPAHDTTAQKLFLQTREDAETFVGFLEASGDLASADGLAISAFPIVRTRVLNAREIIRKGRFTSAADAHRAAPPLQMPAWHYLLDERDIDALLAYFVSLQQWEDEEASPP